MGDDDEFYEERVASVPARRIDFLILGVDLARGLASAVEGTLDSLTQILAMHANYKLDQKRFADAIRLDLETLHEEE